MFLKSNEILFRRTLKGSSITEEIDLAILSHLLILLPIR
jgi:hypothetical protein